MPASEHTKNFNLPIYKLSDHIATLSDQNAAMQKIDEVMGIATVEAKNASRDATAALEASNDAQEKATSTLAKADAATTASSNARGDSKRALDRANQAIEKADNASAGVVSATTISEQANQNATNATAKAGVALDTANAAAQSAAASNETVSQLNTQITNAIKAGNTATKLAKRFVEIRMGDGEKLIRGSQNNETTVFGDEVTFESDEVFSVALQVHIDMRSWNDVNIGIRVTAPDGSVQKFWQAGSPGNKNGGWAYTNVAGTFRASGGAGRYKIDCIYLGPGDEGRNFYQTNCRMVIH